MTANAPWRSPATVGWCQLLLDSYAHWFGEQLVVRGGSPEDEAEELFGAPFLVASHRFADDPVFNFGNQVALDVLELEWDGLIRLPSRRTTEPDLRPERAQMLAESKAQGFFRGYSGVRVSSRGRRMRIEDATLWNVLGPDGEALGQAVTSPRCTPLPTPLPDPPAQPVNVAGELVRILAELGVERAFGVSGGAVAPLWAALGESAIDVIHCRHESGAAFAALEAYFASGRAAAVFTTTGPGLTNALTGVVAARSEGAKLLFLTPFTAAGHRGRFAFQETGPHTLPVSGLFTAGPLFHYAAVVEDASQLPAVARALAAGLARSDGFVAHLSIPTMVQTSTVSGPTVLSRRSEAPPLAAAEATVERCAALLSEGPFGVWVGFGARAAWPLVRELIQKTGAPVFCSPRAKGIVSENDPQFVGVTGFGGHASVLRYVDEHQPRRILVLGTRLGELTSYWNPAIVPEHGFVHVDLDPDVPGAAFPGAETFGVQSDVAAFLAALIPRLAPGTPPPSLPRPERPAPGPAREGPVRPSFLQEEVQHVFVDGSDALVMAEPGNALAFANHMLRFDRPGRYRVSTSFSSMGHSVTGIVGAALATGKKSVSIAGDGAMLMLSEVNTAVQHALPVVWVVQNDAGYNMCAQGMKALGYQKVDCRIPRVDLAAVARGLGAQGIRVTRETDVREALEQVLRAAGPVVVDVVIDASEPAPYGPRLQALKAQGATLPNGGET